MRPSISLSVRLLVLAALLVSIVSLAPDQAEAYPGAPWFEPSKPYSGNFPDPDVLVVGDTYYAYATATGGAYLPVATSTDLRTWTARPAYDPGPPLNSDRYFNDALPYPAAWGADRPTGGRLTKEVWAPGVERIGGRYVAYYTVRHTLGDPGRFCISVAVSSSPLGPFRDDSTGPLVCDPDPAGSIDPAPFVDSDGTPWLLWKSEGIPGQTPTRIWVRRLRPDGLGFAGGSQKIELLRTSLAWEGNVIENPSMVRHEGRLYLFYSANEHASANYAIGYAECASVTGPCHKQSTDRPLLASRGDRLGPGGPSAFVDRGGRLQMAYHYWNAPYTSYPAYPQCVSAGTCTTQGQRRMAVEEVSRGAGGRLQIGPVTDQWVDMAARSQTDIGRGYWLVSQRGRVRAFGTATQRGDVSGIRLNHPVVGMAPTPSGSGYWLVASDGGIFAFGDARFYGSTGAMRLHRPIVGMASTPSGRGYWLAASDGGIFAFGDARFYGSTGAIRLNQPIVAMEPSPTGAGYWLAASDGGIFSFGDAPYLGRPSD